MSHIPPGPGHTNAGPRSQILRKFFANLRRSLRGVPKESKRICEEIGLFSVCVWSGFAPGLLLTLFGCCSDFFWVHPNIPGESPNKVRTTPEHSPNNVRRGPGAIPKPSRTCRTAILYYSGIEKFSNAFWNRPLKQVFSEVIKLLYRYRYRNRFDSTGHLFLVKQATGKNSINQK